jgi:hypothetical protein
MAYILHKSEIYVVACRNTEQLPDTARIVASRRALEVANK